MHKNKLARPWVVARIVAVVLSLLGTTLLAATVGAGSASAVGNYDNAAIADKALTYVGQKGGNACAEAAKPGDSGGQCRAFVNCIVWMVSNHTQDLGNDPNHDYFAAFTNASNGGVEVLSTDSLVKGDIVQVGQGTHTFIIVSKVSAGQYTVVDSNADNVSEKVTTYQRPVALDGSTTRAFRMGTVTDSNTGTKAPSYLAAGTNTDGTIEVFAVDAAGKINIKRQTSPNTNNWWSTWAQIQGTAKSVAVTNGGDGRLYLFYVGGDGKLYYRYQQTPSVDNWSNEIPISANLPGPLAAQTNADGTIEVLAVSDTGKIHVLRQTAPTSDNWWNTWGTINANAKGIATGKNADGRLELFHIGGDNGLWYRYQATVNTDNWSEEKTLQGNMAGRAASGTNTDGTEELFAVGSAGQIYLERQTAPNNDAWWSSWGTINAQARSIAVTKNQDGRLQLFLIGADGSVMYRYQGTASVDNWSNELPLGGTFKQ